MQKTALYQDCARIVSIQPMLNIIALLLLIYNCDEIPDYLYLAKRFSPIVLFIS